MKGQQYLVWFGYDGQRFHGLQPQSALPTAGGALKERIMQAAGRAPGALTFAARTDAGVHALANLAGFRLPRDACDAGVLRQIEAWRPDGLYGVVVRPHERLLHARAEATAKLYRYRLHDGQPPESDADPYVWQITPALDVAAMRRAACRLVGTHDFSSFRSRRCSASSPVRTLQRVDVVDWGLDPHGGRRVVIDCLGDGFLRRMVRVIVGTLAEIGSGLRPPEAIDSILAARHRDAAGVTAPAHALTLVHVLSAHDASR